MKKTIWIGAICAALLLPGCGKKAEETPAAAETPPAASSAAAASADSLPAECEEYIALVKNTALAGRAENSLPPQERQELDSGIVNLRAQLAGIAEEQQQTSCQTSIRVFGEVMAKVQNSAPGTAFADSLPAVCEEYVALVKNTVLAGRPENGLAPQEQQKLDSAITSLRIQLSLIADEYRETSCRAAIRVFNGVLDKSAESASATPSATPCEDYIALVKNTARSRAQDGILNAREQQELDNALTQLDIQLGRIPEDKKAEFCRISAIAFSEIMQEQE